MSLNNIEQGNSKRLRLDEKDEPLDIEERRGEWRTHIFIPVDICLDSSCLKLLPKGTKILDNVHISLSKSCSLIKHEIEAVKLRIGQNITGIKPFSARLNGEELMILNGDNDEFFGALPILTGKIQLNMLIDAVDDALKTFGKDFYHSERILHASILTWTGQEINGGDLQHILNVIPGPCLNILVSKIVMRAGHLRFDIPLDLGVGC